MDEFDKWWNRHYGQQTTWLDGVARGSAYEDRKMISIENIARIAHEVNRAYCEALGDTSQVPWESAPEWQRQSAINGVKFHIANPDASPSASHDAWLAEKEADGWRYGPVKNSATKEHPCFVAYDELPVEQRAKDFLFRGTVHALLRLAEVEDREHPVDPPAARAGGGVMRERHARAIKALAAMLHKAQGVRDTERGQDIDIGGEVVTVRTVLDEYRAALAAATDRVLAAATDRAEAEKKAHEMMRNEIGQLEYVIGEAERQAEALEKERDAAIARVEAAEASARESLEMYRRALERNETLEAECDRLIDGVIRWNAGALDAEARADVLALAARLAEVDDRERPA